MIHIECLAIGFGVNLDDQATGLPFKASISASKRLQHFKQCRGKLVKDFILIAPIVPPREAGVLIAWSTEIAGGCR